MEKTIPHRLINAVDDDDDVEMNCSTSAGDSKINLTMRFKQYRVFNFFLGGGVQLDDG